MADAKASTFSKITPVLTDYLMALDDPGGTPANANIEITDLLTLLKASTDTYYYGAKNVKYLTEDVDSTNDTTLSTITGFSYTLVNGGVYRFSALLYTNSHGSGGDKVSVNGTATFTTLRYRVEMIGNTTIYSSRGATFGDEEGDTAEHNLIRINGYIVVDAGGTLTIAHAQNASYATKSSVLAGSWYEVQKIA